MTFSTKPRTNIIKTLFTRPNIATQEMRLNSLTWKWSIVMMTTATLLRISPTFGYSLLVQITSRQHVAFNSLPGKRFTSHLREIKRSTSSHFRWLSSANGDELYQELKERKTRLVFLGTPDVAAESLLSLIEESKKSRSCFDIVGVVSQPPKRRKRKGQPEPTPVGKVAEEHEIPFIFTPEKASDPVFLDFLEQEVRPDICITAAYGQYLPKRFLSMPPLGTVNIHPSLLPRWRGASPVQRSLEAGDNPIGVSLLYTVSKMDAGPIICKTEYDVGPNEQATEVLAHLFRLGTKSLLECLPDIVSGDISFDTASPQQEDQVVKADMIQVSEGELKPWETSATIAHNKVRALSIWPGTWMYFKIGESNEPVRVKVVETRVLNKIIENNDVSAKQVRLGPEKGSGLEVVFHDGTILELLKVQPETKKVMDAKSFWNGLRGQSLDWVDLSMKPTITVQ